MASATTTATATATAETSKEDSKVYSRAYQLEMLEESLKRNVIVAMDTGSGKTHVYARRFPLRTSNIFIAAQFGLIVFDRAVLRIKKELEVAPTGKLIWFLTPTVALCLQQLSVLQTQISSVQIKSFTSHDNVSRWTEKRIWDAVLTNVNVVVSTYAVLYEALCHASISMETLALIVFDEAHNCIKKSPGSKLMQDYYWPEKKSNKYVPHILGLTASPVMGSNLDGLQILESILDATCKSPRKQKLDLSLHVKLPIMIQILFNGNQYITTSLHNSGNMRSLKSVYLNLNIEEDPEVIRLRTTNTDASRRKLEQARMGKKTFIQNQMRSFLRTAGEIGLGLGTWAANAYIFEVTSSFIRSTDSKDNKFLEWQDDEKQYLANALRSLELSSYKTQVLLEKESISEKARALIQFLGSCHESTIGIIFVKERATAHMLHRLLFDHPDTCDRFSLGVTVGTSMRPAGKRDIFDFSHHESQSKTLAKFRSGEINILVATSVLEEGIDIPQCSLVICFDEPANLKSFVQRRGRARLRESKLVMFLESASRNRLAEWKQLEHEMKLLYEIDERAARKLAEHEEVETEHCQRRIFRVPSTGALVDMDSAKGHLDCFCSRLSSHSHVQMRPEYIIKEENMENQHDEPPLLRATVTLPVTLDPILRTHKSRTSWRSEKNATKDAAFEAYVALYRAGLVTDQLLPLNFPEPSKYMEKQDSIIEVQEQLNPWPGVARAWENKEKIERRVLTLKDEAGLTKCDIEMLMPVRLPNMKSIPIYWDASREWKIEIGLSTTIQDSELTQDDTSALLSNSYGHRWQTEQLKHVVLFKAQGWKTSLSLRGVLRSIFQDCMKEPVGLLRDFQKRGYPYVFQKWLPSKPPSESIQKPHKDYGTFSPDQSFVALKKWSARSDFLHPVQESATVGLEKEYFKVLPQTQLATDSVPIGISQFGLLIPSLLHKVQVQLVVAELCGTLLSEIEILDHDLIRTAISTSVAREQENYQKLEFLGDSVLKFLVSIFAASKYPHWPESYLSGIKDSIVSNSRLCKAAIDGHLDKFILTKSFTGRKWRPMYVETLLEERGDRTRRIPSKTVADVVESLIGAGWRMGQHQTALSIIKLFLPEVDLPSLEVGRLRLFDIAPADMPLPADLHHLESMAGYTFQKKSLLVQSMSHHSDLKAIASYERLEFLGDAILEIIIVTELMAYEGILSHSLMHLYKTTLVNGDYLSFLALEWKIAQKKSDVKEDSRSGRFNEVESLFYLPLWRFMRHGLSSIGETQREVERRHALLRCEILQEFEGGREYPWGLLARMHANKFYSDLIESLLGAVWVDSGSLEVCKQVLDRMGMLKLMHRLVTDHVHALHPREELCILAGDQEVKYEMQKHESSGGEWICTVYVGKSQIIEVLDGVSEEEAKTRAAGGAVALLRLSNGRTGSPVPYL